jgi:ABC-2 type transport system permease protein
MRLLGVELSRFRSRRAIVLILIAATAITAVLAFTAVWDTRPVGAADQARAQALAEREAARPEFRRQMAACEKHPMRYIGSKDAADCVQMTPQVDWFLDRSELSLEQEANNRGLALPLILAALSILVGATFAGSDWSTGSISNQLIFEPRRARVWAAKAAAVTLGALVAALVLVAAFWATLYLVAESRGLGTGAGVQEDIRWMAARGVLLAGFGALAGYAATMLLRNTVATVGVMFAYAVGGEALTAALPLHRATQWGLGNNVFAWLEDGTSVYDQSIACPPTADMCDQSYLLTLGHGTGYLGVLLVGLLAVSLLLFRRRDIP